MARIDRRAAVLVAAGVLAGAVAGSGLTTALAARPGPAPAAARAAPAAAAAHHHPAEHLHAAGGYELVPAPGRPAPGRTGSFSFRIVDGGGRTVTGFAVTHTKLLHLIVVSRDLAVFQHLHPVMSPSGTWSTPLTLPTGGGYRAFADFATAAGPGTAWADLSTLGPAARPVALPRAAPMARTGPFQVTLDLAARRQGDGWAAGLGFTVTRAGRPVRDLQPYLGAGGHLVAIKAGSLTYAHVHPGGDGMAGMGAAKPGDGRIDFASTLPAGGRWRLFMQFQQAGIVRTAAFTLDLP